MPAAIAHTAAPTGKKDKGKGKAVPAAASSGPVWTEAEDDDLVDALDAVDCGSEQVARALMGWFGEELEVAGKRRWKVDARQVVKEVGIVLLASGGVRPPVSLAQLTSKIDLSSRLCSSGDNRLTLSSPSGRASAVASLRSASCPYLQCVGALLVLLKVLLTRRSPAGLAHL